MFKKVSETLGQRKQNRFLYYKVCRIFHMLICIMSLPGIKCSFSKKLFFFIASFHLFVHESKNYWLSVYWIFSFLQLTFLYGQETEVDQEIMLNVEWWFHAGYWMLEAGTLGQPKGMVWGGRREEGSG